jgi:predicted TIM-barrel fold metal-dependent hydrolase
MGYVMNKYIQVLILSLFAIIGLTGLHAVAQDYVGSKATNIIDFHAHVNLDSGGYDYTVSHFLELLKNERLVKNQNISSTFILSPSFNPEGSESYGAVSQKQAWLNMHQEISDLTLKYPGKFYGICGIDILSPASVAFAADCLRIKNMVGVKLHLGGVGQYLSPRLAKTDKNLKAFETLAREVDKKSGVILIHFAFEFNYNKEDQVICNNTTKGYLEETQALLSISKKYQNAKFIIAHGGIAQAIGLNGLEYIAQKQKANPLLPRNIYVETSLVLTHLDCGNGFKKAWTKEHLPIVGVFRKLGMDRVLFGTDYPAPQTNILEDSGIFTQKELDQIYRENGLELIKDFRKN